MRPAVTAAIASSSRSKTRAGPRWKTRSWPAIFTTQPSGARLPRRMTRPPVGLSGSACGRTTTCPGVSAARAASSAKVRPVTVSALPSTRPAATSRLASTPELDRREPPAGLQVRPERRAAAHAIEVVDGERHAGLAGDREEMEDRVGRAAARGHAGDGVLEGGAGDDAPGRAFVAQRLDGERAHRDPDTCLGGIGCGHARTPHRGEPEELERHRHRVGGELPAAGPRARADVVLEVLELRVAQTARGMRAHRLEEVLDRDVAPPEAPGLDRAAVEDHAGDVEPEQRHRRRRDGLVAAHEHDERVEHVAARHELDRVRDHLARDERGLHALGAHRDSVADGDRVELHRRAAGFAHAALDVLGEGAQAEVAGHGLGPGVGDADHGTRDVRVGQADGLEIAAGGRAMGAVVEEAAARARGGGGHGGRHWRAPAAGARAVAVEPAVGLDGAQRRNPMAIKVGDTLPADLKLKEMGESGPKDVTLGEITRGKKVVLFAVPGAFTPTCSMKHLPGFVEHAAAIRAKGVDEIVCVAVNDAFVMDAWGKASGAAGKVRMLADGNGEFTRAMGLELDASGFGMGKRSQRYAMIVKDGQVEHLLVEPGPGLNVSSAESVLAKL